MTKILVVSAQQELCPADRYGLITTHNPSYCLINMTGTAYIYHPKIFQPKQYDPKNYQHYVLDMHHHFCRINDILFHRRRAANSRCH